MIETIADVLNWYQRNSPTRSRIGKGERERLRLYRVFALSDVDDMAVNAPTPTDATAKRKMGDMPVHECRPHHLLTFINERVQNAWTKKRFNATLQRPFNFAVRLGLIDRNPFRGLTFGGGKNGRDWTDEEFQALLRAASPCMKKIMVMVRFSGMRPGEVSDIEPRHVMAANGLIMLDRHKTFYRTGKPRFIPLNVVTAKLLAYMMRNRIPSCKKLFFNSIGNVWTTRALSKNVQLIRERIGMAADVRLHGGRHYFATHAIMNGVDVATLAELLGHSSITTTQRYTHLADKSGYLTAAMERAIGHGAQE
jgi:integrase